MAAGHFVRAPTLDDDPAGGDVRPEALAHRGYRSSISRCPSFAPPPHHAASYVGDGSCFTDRRGAAPPARDVEDRGREVARGGRRSPSRSTPSAATRAGIAAALWQPDPARSSPVDQRLVADEALEVVLDDLLVVDVVLVDEVHAVPDALLERVAPRVKPVRDDRDRPAHDRLEEPHAPRVVAGRAQREPAGAHDAEVVIVEVRALPPRRLLRHEHIAVDGGVVEGPDPLVLHWRIGDEEVGPVGEP